MTKFEKCLWIMESLLDSNGLSLKEINDKWEKSANYDGKVITAKSFGRYKEYIGEIIGLDIEYSPHLRIYIVKNREVVDNNQLYRYILDAFHINEIRSLAIRHRKKIMLQEAPIGIEYLSIILQAINNKQTAIFSYRSYYTPDRLFHFEIIPCFLRLFEGRWYLICEYLDRSQVRVLALERMSEIAIGKNLFTPSSHINPQDYYSDCYGIIRDDKEPQVIKLKVYDKQADYVRSQPIHHTQEEIEKRERYSIFSYYLRPSFDFVQKLLWNMDKVEVIKPAELRQEMKDILGNMLRRYE